MAQLGKMPDPQTGEVARHLDSARMTIDLLEMLQAKCRDNTDREIVAALDQAVMNLQLNFADEMRKQRAADAAAAESGDDGTAADADGADDADDDGTDDADDTA
jgi:hypothetical protein